MSDEFLKFGERLMTLSLVKKGPRIEEDLKNTTEIFLQIARAPAAVVEEDEEAPSATKEIPPSPNVYKSRIIAKSDC